MMVDLILSPTPKNVKRPRAVILAFARRYWPDADETLERCQPYYCAQYERWLIGKREEAI